MGDWEEEEEEEHVVEDCGEGTGTPGAAGGQGEDGRDVLLRGDGERTSKGTLDSLTLPADFRP